MTRYENATTVTARAAVQNGIKSPVRMGKISFAWDLFDSATGPILAAHMPALAAMTGMNLENLCIELRRWKRFHGVQTGARA